MFAIIYLYGVFPVPFDYVLVLAVYVIRRMSTV